MLLLHQGGSITPRLRKTTTKAIPNLYYQLVLVACFDDAAVISFFDATIITRYYRIIDIPFVFG
jgi:hypothetical protein